MATRSRTQSERAATPAAQAAPDAAPQSAAPATLTLRAKTRILHDGQAYLPGEIFDCASQPARALIEVGAATPAA